MSTAFVFLHASTSNRSTWFWTLVAFIPVLGPVLYFTYDSYKNSLETPLKRAQRRERFGRYATMFRTLKARERELALLALSRYRDKEIEALIRDCSLDIARTEIDETLECASNLNEREKVETMNLYICAIEEIKRSGAFPEILLKFWLKDGLDWEKSPVLRLPIESLVENPLSLEAEVQDIAMEGWLENNDGPGQDTAQG